LGIIEVKKVRIQMVEGLKEGVKEGGEDQLLLLLRFFVPFPPSQHGPSEKRDLPEAWYPKSWRQEDEGVSTSVRFSRRVEKGRKETGVSLIVSLPSLSPAFMFLPSSLFLQTHWKRWRALELGFLRLNS